jgi:S1-C subfamily serine protease
MPSKATRVFLPLLCLLLPQHQARAQGKARAETVVNQIRDMKTAVVQIRYTSDAPRAPQASPIEIAEGTRAGTGFFVSPQGYVLTAGHVIRGAEISARTAGATKVGFKVGMLLDTSSMSQVNFRGSFFWVGVSLT